MFVIRTGGEGFALIVKGTTYDVSFEIVDLIRLLVAQNQLKDIEPGLNCWPDNRVDRRPLASEVEISDELYGQSRSRYLSFGSWLAAIALQAIRRVQKTMVRN